ncbi:hypothetical protein G293_01115 [Candidatus Liberibacter africanus PTSAPSY]|uniref:Uncharacterized protein n=1 Tax=Candidatus Liberibacter africanus PTSAPSY TaxID=1277257 RepID=A0A0G3I1V9_LIBAF|nr:hypothetical protein G293_01115 [Candidatus Liberibacter africanus PTSAPSY]
MSIGKKTLFCLFDNKLNGLIIVLYFFDIYFADKITHYSFTIKWNFSFYEFDMQMICCLQKGL